MELEEEFQRHYGKQEEIMEKDYLAEVPQNTVCYSCQNRYVDALKNNRCHVHTNYYIDREILPACTEYEVCDYYKQLAREVCR